MEGKTVRAIVMALACAMALALGLAGCDSSSESSGSASSGPSPSIVTTDEDPFAQPVTSEDEAVTRIHDLLMRAGKEIPPKIEFVKMIDGDRYLIHGYEVVNDGGGYTHEATWFYYSIGEDGSVRDETLFVDIDPLTMEPM